eukprot:CAMPEP_0175143726 /NCGR_PEP_ID=MMETSP0087-20121206/13647_1 /TAXON_ID=136419 /ORGANISM="Unknown Unknown, Strain D1" /LENGTH=557 /DNA_ID=CAMNT_0016427937 /DNA_START=810 /DNA_END=2483 /DNA_ORIENTATION=+
MMELEFHGPSTGNPFVDVNLFASFEEMNGGSNNVRVRGFYDGNGVYRVRFMPPIPGHWSYHTASNVAELAQRTGDFLVKPADKMTAAPVRARDTRSFEYATGADHISVGTTAYAWIHQNSTLLADTVATLSNTSLSPFNKLRMTIFPKWYEYNRVEPTYFAYEGSRTAGWDFTKFDVTFWQRLDQRIEELLLLDIQADVILFHPYDHGHWGFDCMGGTDADTYDTANDERYLQYVVARLSAYRNVWWSMANEWDLVDCKRKGVPASSPTWDRLFQVLSHEDHANHLTSIHNCILYYNQSQPWVTHISSQGGYDMASIKSLYAPKPIVWDEVMYEGDIGKWGGLTAGQMTDRFWWGLSQGLYTGHGETILTKDKADDDQVLWWSKGGVLRGDSPVKIQYFSSLAAKMANRITCTCAGSRCDSSCLGAHYSSGGITLSTDEETFFVVHFSPYGTPPKHPGATTVELPAQPSGEKWYLHPVDFYGLALLPAIETYQPGDRIATISGETLSDKGGKVLTNEHTTVPCNRSSASCCSSDPVSCTPYTALLVTESMRKQLLQL